MLERNDIRKKKKKRNSSEAHPCLKVLLICSSYVLFFLSGEGLSVPRSCIAVRQRYFTADEVSQGMSAAEITFA